MRLGRVVMLVAGLLAVVNLRAETLRQVLQQNGVPTSAFKPAELDAQVSSGAADSSGDRVILAYPALGEQERIGAPLEVLMYQRATRKLMRRTVTPAETSDECFGSVLRIFGLAGYILVETHINPSASCTIVLDSELRVKHTLFGWSVAQLGQDAILLEEDEIHFASVHPLRLAVFDPAAGLAQEVYPPDGDPLRERFSSDLNQHLPTAAWCREHNHPCDPSSFDEDLGEAAYADSEGRKFAFVASYDAGGFGDAAERAVGIRSVLYVYRRSGEGWTYCQDPLSNLEVETRQELLKNNFEQATGRCTHGTDVKVRPVASPFSDIPVGGRAARP